MNDFANAVVAVFQLAFFISITAIAVCYLAGRIIFGKHKTDAQGRRREKGIRGGKR